MIRREKWAIGLLALAGCVCSLAAYYLPMWTFKFIAPQYPQGLIIDIFLSGPRGDVFEIDIINHYIGMGKLSQAASIERLIAPYAIIFFCCSILLFALFNKKLWAKVLVLPTFFFPVGFVGIFFLWLYKFGHELDTAAPVRMAPFTPTILGHGIVGNFKSFATPGLGYWCILASSLSVFLIYYLSKSKKIDK